MRLVNGRPSATLDASDRGLHYGDGLFETMAVVDGQIPLWDRHIKRLRSGCRRLGFDCPDEALLRGEAEQLMASAASRWILKLILTRGSGGLYRPPVHPNPTRILEYRPWPNHPRSHWERGIEVRMCQTKLAWGSPVAGLKHLNRLEQVLARREWQEAEPAEGLMCDSLGKVVEGTMTNLFIQEGSRLVTPPVDSCGVAGVMRDLVMELAPEAGLIAEEREVDERRLLAADGAFVTNAVIGLWPVRHIGSREYRVTEAFDRLWQEVRTIIGSRP